MRAPWRRRPTLRTRRLLSEAGLGTRTSSDLTDLTACQHIAYRAARRDSTTLKPVLAAAEDMLLDETNYETVVFLLENIQNLISHELDLFWTSEHVTELLGPKCTVCWTALTTFWNSVAAWCTETGVPGEPREPLIGVENEQLRILVWTSNRTQPNGQMLGLDHAVFFEKAGQPSIPGFSHIAAALAGDGSSAGG